MPLRLPLLQHLRGYTWVQARHDLRAGLNVALLDFPQSMAYALIAGLPVSAGLRASALGSLTGPLLASSRFLMLGPTNATAILLLSALAVLPIDASARLAALPLLLLLVALFFCLGALLNAAVIIRYISRTVITGYVTAGGCLIVALQLKNVLGLELPNDPVLLISLVQVFRHLPETDPASLITATVTLLTYTLLRRHASGLPVVAVTLAGVTIIAQGLSTVFAIPLATLDPVRAGLWDFTWPRFDLELIQLLIGPALAVAFLALLESASIAKALAARAGDTVNISQQMISMSVANAANALGGGMPVSGSLTRSHLNWSSGARTPLASIFSGGFVLAGILALGPLIGFIPQAALSALVIAVGVGLFDLPVICTILRTTRADATTFVITLASGLLLPLHIAIFVGVTASLLFFLHKVSQPRIVEHAFGPQGTLVESSVAESTPIPSVSIVHVEGDLFFGATDLFLEQMRLLVRQGNLKAVILRLRNAQHLDATSALAIGELHDFARGHGCAVLVTDLQPETAALFHRSGLTQRLGREQIFLHDPLNTTLAMKHALKHVQGLTDSVNPEFILFARPHGSSSDDSRLPPSSE